MDWIPFGVTAAILLLGAWRVVTTPNLVHTVLWLGLTLAVTAAAFVQLEASFLAMMQLVLYTGGVLTLMLFGVMLTNRGDDGLSVPNPSANRLRAGALALAVFALLAAAILQTPLPEAQGPTAFSAQALGLAFLTDHLLAFELLSVLLLMAMVGAIVIARTRDHGAEDAGQLVGGRRLPGRVIPPADPTAADPGRQP